MFENIRVQRIFDTLDEVLDDDYKSDDKLDYWITSLTNKLQIDIDNAVDTLELYKIPDSIMRYIDMMTNIWVKFSRDRLKNNCNAIDTKNSVNTLYRILLQCNHIISPFIPFNSDILYNTINCNASMNELNLENFNSIHVKFMNKVNSYDSKILESVYNVNSIIELVRHTRSEMNKQLTTPIKNMEVYLPEMYKDKIDIYFDKYISEQANVENTIYFYQNNNCDIKIDKGAIGKKFRKDSKKVIDIINKSTFDELINNNVYYNYNEENICITSEFFKITTNKVEKEGYYSLQSNNYMILLDTTLDEDLLWKTKLNMWKRDIQNSRKELNYQFWDKLILIVDSQTIDIEKFNEWKEYFENIINSQVIFETNLNEYREFKYEDNCIHYALSE